MSRDDLVPSRTVLLSMHLSCPLGRWRVCESSVRGLCCGLQPPLYHQGLPPPQGAHSLTTVISKKIWRILIIKAKYNTYLCASICN